MSEFEWLKRARAIDEAGTEDLEGRVVAALRTVYDPEIPVNIYDLGLVYALDVDEPAARVGIRMTLTAPGCPVAQTFPATVEEAVRSVRGVDHVHVELVWDPPWSRDRMSDAARLQLGML
jgi:FeS assembly SUF system protein